MRLWSSIRASTDRKSKLYCARASMGTSISSNRIIFLLFIIIYDIITTGHGRSDIAPMAETAATDPDPVRTAKNRHTKVALQVVEQRLTAAHELLYEHQLGIDLRETVVHITGYGQTVTGPQEMNSILVTLRLSRIAIGIVRFNGTIWELFPELTHPVVDLGGLLLITQLRIQLHDIRYL